MNQPKDVREALLTEIRAREPKSSQDQSLDQMTILEAIEKQFAANQDFDLQQAILTQWSELFRTGLLAWGLNINNPGPPHFHLTERGRTVLGNLTRDPSNPAGYLRHLSSIATLSPVALSYLNEALECYVDGHFKAAAVMVGCSAESIILDLRDTTRHKLQSLAKPCPKPLEDWRVKTVSDALHSFFDGHKLQLKRNLREPFEAYWSAFAQQIRSVRNDAGHPLSVDPVTPDMVHASLLIFLSCYGWLMNSACGSTLNFISRSPTLHDNRASFSL